MCKNISNELSKELWIANKQLAKASLKSTFVQGIKNGDLKIDDFKSYIAQDAYFLEAFAKAYGMAIAKSPDKHSITTLSEMLCGVIEELNMHDSYFKKWNLNPDQYPLKKETKYYTDFLAETCFEGDMIVIIAAMIPCMRLYSWIGQKLIIESNLTKNKYIDWIKTYSDKTFDNLGIKLEKLMNQYYENKNINEITTAYSRAMKLEYEFFIASSQPI